MLSITKKKSKTSNLNYNAESPKRQPVLVYNSRIDSLLSDVIIDVKEAKSYNVTADWRLFMDDLNTEMFDKISF